MESKIDVHAHFVPPFYAEALASKGYNPPDGMPGVPTWSAEAHIAFMDKAQISKAILSLSSPGVSFVNDRLYTRTLCRKVNDFVAQAVRENPTRFGYFASLPLPNVEDSIAEIHHAVASGCSGFALMSNALGIYLGDPSLRPVLQTLDDISAVVFIHPTSSCNRHVGDENLSPQTRFEHSSPLAPYYRTPLFEFFFESARTFLDLVLSGQIKRFPRIRWISSHCGNVLPCLIDRPAILTRAGLPLTTTRDALPMTEDEIRRAFRENVWYDLAGLPVPNQVRSILDITRPERLMVGSDVPWTAWDGAADLLKSIEEALPELVERENLHGIYRGNAARLLGLE
jgi:6-methylsalicylate decarboxylase